MRLTYVVHIAAGALGLLSGYAALFTTKGAPLHRRAGTVFVWTMLSMCGAGVAIAALRGIAPWLNIPAGLLTGSLVATALTTVRPATRITRRFDRVATAVMFGVAVTTLTYGVRAASSGGPGLLLFPLFMFGTVALLAVAGDVRVARRGVPQGSRRIARHLWRMTYALFVAAMSFFIGQAKVIPEAFRHPVLLAFPVLVVLVALVYWMWRVRWRGSLRGLALQTVGARSS